MTVLELAQRLREDDPPVVVDVREEHELEISKLHSAIHMPMSELSDRYHQLDREARLAILCRVGYRSAQVVNYLRDLGYQNVENVEGGINAWAEEIDPTMSVY